MKYLETARRALAHISDDEYAALKVPAYPDTRVLAAAAFIIAHANRWVTCYYLKEMDGEHRATSYTINFKRDQANEYVSQIRWPWVKKGLLPVDWFYRFAMKGEYNMGWLNLKKVFYMEVKNPYTGNMERCFFTGLTLDDDMGPYWPGKIREGLRQQEEQAGLKVVEVSQAELLKSVSTKVYRRRADVEE